MRQNHQFVGPSHVFVLHMDYLDQEQWCLQDLEKRAGTQVKGSPKAKLVSERWGNLLEMREMHRHQGWEVQGPWLLMPEVGNGKQQYNRSKHNFLPGHLGAAATCLM